MGIEPVVLASTLEVVVAQRLVRRICTNCRYSTETKIEDLDTPKLKCAMKYFPKKGFKLYRGKGCKACKHTGYRGQTALYEFIQVDQKMEELIITSPTSQEIWDLARENGAKTLFEDGIDKVKNGITTLEDLLRVAQPPENVSEEMLAEIRGETKSKKATVKKSAPRKTESKPSKEVEQDEVPDTQIEIGTSDDTSKEKATSAKDKESKPTATSKKEDAKK